MIDSPFLRTITAMTQLNVVLILADDMGFSDLGCRGTEIDMLSIDSMARKGRLGSLRLFTGNMWGTDLHYSVIGNSSAKETLSGNCTI